MAFEGITTREATRPPFQPALIVVDMQEDFCPPNGTLAVQGARDLAPLINKLLSRAGFVLKVATQDFHPSDHISFAMNHPSPNNKPFESFIDMKNPAPGRGMETKPQRLWPPHCIQNTGGAEIIPEIDKDRIDIMVTKGMNPHVEMYSAFKDAFGNSDCVSTGGVNIDLEKKLREKEISDVFLVGVAGDYCVKYTAIDAASRGFKAWVIEEGTKSVDPDTAWSEAKKKMTQHDVHIIGVDGPELARVQT